MKNRFGLKCLFLAAVAMAAASAFPDVLVPTPHVMSHAEWTAAMKRYSALWRRGIPCFAAEAFLVALFLSVRQKQTSIMVWLAFSAPVAFLLPIVWQDALHDTCVFSVLGVSAVAGLLSIVHCFFERKMLRAILLIFAIPGLFIVLFTFGGRMWFVTMSTPAYIGGIVAASPNESYGEYLKRAEKEISRYPWPHPPPHCTPPPCE